MFEEKELRGVFEKKVPGSIWRVRLLVKSLDLGAGPTDATEDTFLVTE